MSRERDVTSTVRLDGKSIEAAGSWKQVIAGSLLSIGAAIHELAAQVGRVADALDAERDAR